MKKAKDPQDQHPQKAGDKLGQPVPPTADGADPHQKEEGGQQDQGLLHLQVHGVVEAVGHIGRRVPPGHVGGEEDAPPEAEHIVVDQAKGERQQGPRGAGPLVPA